MKNKNKIRKYKILNKKIKKKKKKKKKKKINILLYILKYLNNNKLYIYTF